MRHVVGFHCLGESARCADTTAQNPEAEADFGQTDFGQPYFDSLLAVTDAFIP